MSHASDDPVINLKGITWDHSRALPPLVAAAQRHGELKPSIRVQWEKRTLHEFGHMPISALAERFDLIVIDHPFAGQALSDGLVHDFRTLLTEEQFTSLQRSFVGPSFGSYQYDGKLLAIPIDAATPCPSWCADAFTSPPSAFEEVLELAAAGRAIMPGFGPDLFLNWLMFVESLGGQLFGTPDRIADRTAAMEATEMLMALAAKMPGSIAELNPIRVAELLSRDAPFVYCPFAYSYNNYSRRHFAKRPLRYGGLVTLKGKRLRSIIGGTGIAISRRCKSPALAMEHAMYCASSEVQRGVYSHSGGQPAHVDAWDDPDLNQATDSFFRNTRQAINEAIVRPRYAGWVPLQEAVGRPLQECIIHRTRSVVSTINEIDSAFSASLPDPEQIPTL